MEEVEFVVVENQGSRQMLACPSCGAMFDINVMTWENLVWDEGQKCLVSVCPDCGARQK